MILGTMDGMRRMKGHEGSVWREGCLASGRCWWWRQGPPLLVWGGWGEWVVPTQPSSSSAGGIVALCCLGGGGNWHPLTLCTPRMCERTSGGAWNCCCVVLLL
jgi:hypothetical protein